MSAAEWTSYLNDAYTDVIGANPYWPFLEDSGLSAVTVSAGAQSATWAHDSTRVGSVRNATDDIVMEQIDGVDSAARLFPLGDESGTPMYYRMFGGKFIVYPRPMVNTVFDIEHYDASALLTADGDVPVLPPQFHNALVEGALYRAYLDDGAADQAANHYSSFESILERMKSFLLGPPRMGYYPTIADMGI